MTEPNLHGNDLFGAPVEKKHTSKLGGEFMVPPFTVLSAREGWWQERKRAWLALGIKSELGRGEQLIPNGGGHDHEGAVRQGRELATPGGSKMPATNYSKSKARGDGRGRAIQ